MSIGKSIDELDKRITSLVKSFDELEAKLSVILTPQVPMPRDEAPLSDTKSVSNLSSELCSFHDRLHNFERHLLELIERADLP